MTTLLADPLVASVTVASLFVSVLLMYVHPKFAFSIFLISFVPPLTIWGASSDGPTLDTRPLAVIVLLSQGFRILAERKKLTPRPLETWAAILGTFGLLSAFWSDSQGQTIQSGLAWVLLAAAVGVFRQTLKPTEMQRIISGVLILLVLASALLVAIGYPDAFNGGRARGIIYNANGMGIVCVLSTAFLINSRRWLPKLLTIAPIVLVAMSGSRAAAIGVVIAMATVVFLRLQHWARWFAILATIPIVWFLLQNATSFLDAKSGTDLLRSNNSRALVWQQAWDTFLRHPLAGVGAGALSTESGSSYLKLLSEGGLIGAGIGLILYVLLIRASRPSITSLATVVAASADAVFEGWLFAAGSLYCVVVIFVAASSNLERGGQNLDSVDHNHAHPTIRSRPGSIGAR